MFGLWVHLFVGAWSWVVVLTEQGHPLVDEGWLAPHGVHWRLREVIYEVVVETACRNFACLFVDVAVMDHGLDIVVDT